MSTRSILFYCSLNVLYLLLYDNPKKILTLKHSYMQNFFYKFFNNKFIIFMLPQSKENQSSLQFESVIDLAYPECRGEISWHFLGAMNTCIYNCVCNLLDQFLKYIYNVLLIYREKKNLFVDFSFVNFLPTIKLYKLSTVILQRFQYILIY